jgi:hypothetical protein
MRKNGQSGGREMVADGRVALPGNLLLQSEKALKWPKLLKTAKNSGAERRRRVGAASSCQ